MFLLFMLIGILQTKPTPSLALDKRKRATEAAQ